MWRGFCTAQADGGLPEALGFAAANTALGFELHRADGFRIVE